MTTHGIRKRLGALALAALALAAPASAQNAVVQWSEKAQAAVTPGRGPASAGYLLAMVHAAMYDAAVAVEGRYEPFRVSVHRDEPAQPEAAVATAAYHVLRQRVPAMEPTLTAQYAAFLATLPAGPDRQEGIDVGAKVAARWLALRADDGLANAVTYVQPPPGPGVWEPTAPTPPAELVLTQVKPYVLRTRDQLRPRGPRSLRSPGYTRDWEELFELGRADSAVRTPEQTEIARFWSENATVQWSRNLRHIASSAELDLVDSARMLAMAYVSSADAFVACFDAKYHFLYWRPVHAIQRADTDGNRDTVADPTWTSLLNVNHPEFPSAHACLTTAITESLTHVLDRDDMDVDLDSAATGTTRHYDRLSDVVSEVADARVYAGLHFRYSTRVGATIGREAARLVARDYFKPQRRECRKGHE